MLTSTKKINCIIVDDEPLAQKVMLNHIAKYSFLNPIGVCGTAKSAFEMILSNTVDLIFLDINMPVISGLDFLKSLNKPPLVIFTTAYAEYAVDGFELDAVDYLTKPISPERFDKAIAKLLKRMKLVSDENLEPVEDKSIKLPSSEQKKYMFVKTDGKLIKINFEDILYCEGMRDYIKIHLNDGSFIVIHQTMKNLDDLLPDQFMRVHKSYIVSLTAIKSIEDSMVLFSKSNASVPISASYRDELKSRLM